MTGGPPQAATRRSDVVDLHHGVHVPDPYRWLEQGDASDVREWVAARDGSEEERCLR